MMSTRPDVIRGSYAIFISTQDARVPRRTYTPRFRGFHKGGSCNRFVHLPAPYDDDDENQDGDDCTTTRTSHQEGRSARSSLRARASAEAESSRRIIGGARGFNDILTSLGSRLRPRGKQMMMSRVAATFRLFPEASPFTISTRRRR